VAVFCQPKISDDFHADVTLTEQRGTFHQQFEAHLWESYVNHRQRIDANHFHERKTEIEILRFYNNHTEYEIVNKDERCRKRNLNETMHPAFGWVSRAQKSDHPCHGLKDVKGELWLRQDERVEASLCVRSDNINIPLWVEFREKVRREQRHIAFHTFVAENPPANKFVVPKLCK